MASAKMKNPDLRGILGPVLPSLPPAALAAQPSEDVLPLLSPILRQRVQLLSSSSTEPWIRFLCYDTAKAAKLAEIAQSDRLEPHPVSGEIEVDWDYDTEIRYRRVDQETLQALVVLKDKELAFQLVYCTGDSAGEDGWRVGEVTVADNASPYSSFGGVSSIAEADRQFKAAKESRSKKTPTAPSNGAFSALNQAVDEGDDDDYWARYDATPARTPANNVSPAPRSTQARGATAEDDYYAQYDSVQPAMDNHDPDEEVNMPDAAPPLGLARPTARRPNGTSDEELELNETNGAWTLAEPPRSPSVNSRRSDDPNLVHPRPASSASSNASVARLEAAAENFGVQQHISRSVKSLFMLARASGIDREEFEAIVKRELDMLGLMED
ncbi:hypothetical protein BJ170DRAFT_602388 [Xylariales sp. AK1849]|nr:hypothetical protein BJ170DRAFT_602388 [Xylariales sp. AK1849]